ncbi:hypothetical protein Gorai_009196 [Gossypium raimondii]|uniref:Uncharacterized protein n=2 Tax=Gossypium raimondii TaxID=29730 RepID=A0A7J8PTL7_GOSRA|nr:hypothetical protein [Gossypium raimondii]
MKEASILLRKMGKSSTRQEDNYAQQKALPAHKSWEKAYCSEISSKDTKLKQRWHHHWYSLIIPRFQLYPKSSLLDFDI